MAGVENVLTKSLGSSNPHNALKATVRALTSLEDATSVAVRRRISVEKVIKG
jgi:small subunit ribosomal protein S5